MSAWVCSKAHIDAMVTAAIALGGSFADEPYAYLYFGEPMEKIDLSPANAEQVGTMLRDTIVEGVSHRYPDDDVSKGELPGPTDGWYLKPYKHRKTRKLADGEIVALISAYEYQASEHNHWTDTFGWKFCEHVKYKLLKRVEAAFEAKGGKTEWGYEDEHVFPGFKPYLVEFRGELAGHNHPFQRVNATSKKDAAERLKWIGGEVVSIKQTLTMPTKAESDAAWEANEAWKAERAKPEPEPTPEPVEPAPSKFQAPEGVPAELAALLNRVANGGDDEPIVRNS